MANTRLLEQSRIDEAQHEIRELVLELAESSSEHDLANAELLADILEQHEAWKIDDAKLLEVHEKIEAIADQEYTENQIIEIGFGRMRGLFYTPALADAMAAELAQPVSNPFAAPVPAPASDPFASANPFAAPFPDLPGARSEDVDFNLDELAAAPALDDLSYEEEDGSEESFEEEHRPEREVLNTENFGDREFLEVFRAGTQRGLLTVSQEQPYYNHFKWLETKVLEAEMSLTEAADIKKALQTLERMRLMLSYYQQRLRDGQDLPEGVNLSADERAARANELESKLDSLEALIERARTVRDAGINEVVTYSESADVVAIAEAQNRMLQLMGLAPSAEGFEGGALVAGNRFKTTSVVRSAEEARVSVNTVKNIFKGETKVGAIAKVDPERKSLETKLFYDASRLKYHSFRAVTKIAAKLVEDHLALDPRGEKRIILRGNMHEKLVKAVMTYAKAMGYQAINQTRHQKIKVSGSDVRKIRKDIQNTEGLLSGFNKTERLMKLRKKAGVEHFDKQTGADNEVASAAARMRVR